MLARFANKPSVRVLARSITSDVFPGTLGLGGRMSQAPQKVTIFGASTGNLGRSVVYELASRGVTCMIPYRGEGDEVRHLKPSGDTGKVNPIPFHPRDEQSIRDCIGRTLCSTSWASTTRQRTSTSRRTTRYGNEGE
ncbi:hypothetical protein BLSTO_06036 [Blastocystis sp. subtype 1]